MWLVRGQGVGLGTRVGGLGGWQLAAGDDEDVDAGGTGLLENPPYDPPAHGDVRPAAVDGADQDLGDLVLLREADDGPGQDVLVVSRAGGRDQAASTRSPSIGWRSPDRPVSSTMTWTTSSSALYLSAMRAARRSTASVPGAVVMAAMMRSVVSRRT